MTDASDYLEQAEKYALQAMEIIADSSADPQALQRAEVLASMAVFLELRGTRAADVAGVQTTNRLVNHRSDLPFKMRSYRKTVRDRLR